MKFLIVKMLYFLSGRKMSVLLSYFRNRGVYIGDLCHIYSDISTSESYLIHIGNNVTISNDVQFITHDNSISKVLPDFTDVFGEITIGNNVFIGARSVLLPGVKIGDNTIIAAGGIVTKSFGENLIIGGNPARVISDISTYKLKMLNYGVNIDGLSKEQKYNLLVSSHKLIIK